MESKNSLSKFKPILRILSMMRKKVLGFIFCFFLPMGAWGQQSSPHRDTSKELNQLLLYQTFNFSFRNRVGRPGFPGGVSGAVGITEGAGGRYGEAVYFPDGKSVLHYPAMRNFPIPIDRGQGTISIWVSCDLNRQIPGEFAELFEVHSGAWNNGAFSLALTPGEPKDLIFSMYGSSPTGATDSDSLGGAQQLLAAQALNWSATEWHHIAATWSNLNSGHDNGRMALYLDGRRVARKIGFAHEVHWQNSNQNLRLGNGFVGKMDDFAIFAFALSSREIKKLYRHPSGVSGRYLSNLQRKRSRRN